MKISQKNWKRSVRLVLVLIAPVVQAQMKGAEVSAFRMPEYDAQGVMTSQLFGERAEVEENGEVRITGLRIESYKDGKTVMEVTSPYCFFNQKTRDAHSDAPVAATMERMQLQGRGFLLKSGDGTVNVFNESRVTIKDVIHQVLSAAAIDTNETVITSKELFLEYKKKNARFERNVHVQDSKMEMFCDKLEIHAGEGNQIDWIEASTGVRILSEGREALAENAVYNAKSDEFVLRGNPRIFDGRNVLTGDQISFWRGSGRISCKLARFVFYSGDQLKSGLFEK